MRRTATAVLAAVLVLWAAMSCAAPPSTETSADVAVDTEFPERDLAPAPDLTGRLDQAIAGAAERGATLSIAFLDRVTGTYMGTADTDPIETASVVKLFIADDILYRASRGELELDTEVRDLLAPMLSSSDDSAAQVLWDFAGGADLVTRVAERYALASTVAPGDDVWWNTRTTAADLVRYYDTMLDGTGGLAQADRDTVVGLLEAYTPLGADGYPQTFGIPRALDGESVRGIKQGWMCCVDGRWIHLSTGFVGEGERYVVAVLSREDPWVGANGGSTRATADTAVEDDDGAKHARVTVTGALKILFPSATVGS